MTIICAVKKNNNIAMAENTSVGYGDDMVLPVEFFADGSSSTVIRSKNLLVGQTGYTAHYLPLKKLLSSVDGRDLKTRQDVFELFLGFHTSLKEKFFMQTEEEENDPYESSQMTLIIATPLNIFGYESYRSVLDYSKFWAIGSGSEFALGALDAVYDNPEKTASDIARTAAESACKFDKHSDLPVNVHTLSGFEV